MSGSPKELEIITPDDWHLHLRDGEALAFTVPASAKSFNRAIVMPNLVPPVARVTEAQAYRERILEHVPKGQKFEPLMTLYLTDSITPDEIVLASQADFIYGCKLYPAGATTNSDSGVSDLNHLDPVLKAMETESLPLLVHGEVTADHVDIFDREKQFIEQHLKPLQKKFPQLKIVFEHITTADAVEFVENAPDNVAATITPQHLMYNRNDMLVGGIKPHLYCLPILKANKHQKALQKAATSGNPKFFLGTDSAPHSQASKESDCGCAGCYSAPVAMELYATIFERLNSLEKLEGFASVFGPQFYGLPVNKDKILLMRQETQVPATLPFAEGGKIVPLCGGSFLSWNHA